MGSCICKHFNAVARENAAKWGSAIPEEYRLDYLPTDTDEGGSTWTGWGLLWIMPVKTGQK